MNIFITKEASRLARKLNILDESILEAVQRAQRGQIEAHLGSGIIKQRIAGRTRGRSAGNRAILLYIRDDRAVVLYLYSKSDKASLTPREEDAYREAGTQLARIKIEVLETAVRQSSWRKIDYE
jgi:hypothetical protein